MGFFDLNIPYPEPSPSNKKSTIDSNRTKLAVKAMELGFTGIAYNRTMKGVMSDHHRCSISPLSLSSLMNILPSLSLSAKLHRDLLGIPLSTPFRQYTRLTVCVDTTTQAQALNSGNPVLKTYDLVAVRPSNQTAFDQACERMEVDIISIDFSTKLPFRLKQPMVKAATQRGICFEITYSALISDVQARRQLISNAKLLMDWTRGRNIIFSSGAPSVNELRGPCDVANLLSLFGLSQERAKEAISKNCRTLLANSLRKKRFYKDAIRIEVLSSAVATHSKETRHQELLKWDPISSGEGDILLDDLAKSFSTSSKPSKTAKAIDFVSVVDSIPSHGFQVKDFLSANKAFPVFPDNNVEFLSVAENVNQSTPVLNNSTEQPDRLHFFPEHGESSLSDAIATHQNVSCEKFCEKNIECRTTEAVNTEERDTVTDATMLELKNSIDSDVEFIPLEAKAHDSQSELCITNNALDTVIPSEDEQLHRSSVEGKRDDALNVDHEEEIITPSMDIIVPPVVHNKHDDEKTSDVVLNAQITEMQEALTKENFEVANHSVLEINSSISENLIEDEQFDQFETDAVKVEEMAQQTSYDGMKIDDASTVATDFLPESMMEDKNLGEVSIESDQVVSVQSISGRLRAKRRTPRGPLMFPFKPFLNPMLFKKKGKKNKNRTKLK